MMTQNVKLLEILSYWWRSPFQLFEEYEKETERNNTAALN